MRRYPTPLPLALLCLTAIAGCQRGGAPGEPASNAPVRIENPALQLAIAALPAGFDVLANQGETLRLARQNGLPHGEAWVEVGAPVEGGINLVEIVTAQRAAFEALPGGAFSGNRELALPDGRPAYYSRGRFDDDGTKVEEFRISMVHPADQKRLLQVFYRYPAGEDSKDRLEDILFLVGEIEGLATPGPEARAAGKTGTGAL